MTTFSQLLASAVQKPDALELEVPPDWMQGRSVFGGLQVAFALQAMRKLVPSTPLRTLQTTFVAPVSGSMRAQARILRQGKNVTHVQASLGDAAAPEAIVVGAFGRARDSNVARAIARPALEIDPAGVIEVPSGSRSEGAPHFTGHFHVRWLRGKPPFTGDKTYDHVLEVGLNDNDVGRTTEAHLVAIADYPPPVGLSLLTTPAAGSTLTWMLQLLVDDLTNIPLTALRIDAEMVAARDGYTSQSVTIYAPDGTALALSHQNMLIFG